MKFKLVSTIETASSIEHKIRTLLMLTVERGATPAEADSALAKAKQLMEKHGITLEDLYGKKSQSYKQYKQYNPSKQYKKPSRKGLMPLKDTKQIIHNIKRYQRNLGVDYNLDFDNMTWYELYPVAKLLAKMWHDEIHNMKTIAFYQNGKETIKFKLVSKKKKKKKKKDKDENKTLKEKIKEGWYPHIR